MDNNNNNRPNNQGHQGQRPPAPQSAQASREKQGQSSGMSFLQKKCEKLTTALYMVSDIMSDKEPMKWKMRETGVELLSDIAITSGSPSSERMSLLREVMKKIERVVSFLDLAQSARMLSDMNASVLKKEYLALKEATEAEWGSIYDRSKSIFSENFFDVPREAEPALPSGRGMGRPHEQAVREEKQVEPVAPITEPVAVVRAVAPTQAMRSVTPVQFAETPRPIAPSPATATPKQEVFIRPIERPTQAPVETQTVRPITPPASAPFRPETSRVQENFGRARNEGDRGDRRTIILALVKQKPSLTVGDVARSIPGVSEKTIQRELLSMVEEGILAKKGERRWSTYSLRQL